MTDTPTARASHLSLLATLCSLLLPLCCALPGCGAAGAGVAAETSPGDEPRLTAGRRVRFGGNPASFELPKGLLKADATTWVLQAGGGQTELVVKLTVERSPDDGVDAYLDKQIRRIHKLGKAGVLRDEMVPLGDLDGRYIESAELPVAVAEPALRKAIWQVTTEAETGLYTLAVIGLHAAMEREREVLISALRSLRVD
jgi:hypothetical protein